LNLFRNIFLDKYATGTAYFDRLDKLNMKSLEYRWLELDSISMYKICYDLSDKSFD